MPCQQRDSVAEVGDDKLPCLAHGGSRFLQCLHVGEYLVNDRKSPRLTIQLKEHLRMPICQGTVEIALPLGKIQGFLLGGSGVVRAVVANALYARSGEAHPLAEVGVGGGDIARVNSRVVILTGGTLIVRAIDVGGVVVEPYPHREPIESIHADAVALRISGGNQLIHLIHGGREVIRRQGLRIGYIKEILATE